MVAPAVVHFSAATTTGRSFSNHQLKMFRMALTLPAISMCLMTMTSVHCLLIIALSRSQDSHAFQGVRFRSEFASRRTTGISHTAIQFAAGIVAGRSRKLWKGQHSNISTGCGSKVAPVASQIFRSIAETERCRLSQYVGPQK